jgi:hypothetical protein
VAGLRYIPKKKVVTCRNTFKRKHHDSCMGRCGLRREEIEKPGRGGVTEWISNGFEELFSREWILVAREKLGFLTFKYLNSNILKKKNRM